MRLSQEGNYCLAIFNAISRKVHETRSVGPVDSLRCRNRCEDER